MPIYANNQCAIGRQVPIAATTDGMWQHNEQRACLRAKWSQITRK